MEYEETIDVGLGAGRMVEAGYMLDVEDPAGSGKIHRMIRTLSSPSAHTDAATTLLGDEVAGAGVDKASKVHFRGSDVVVVLLRLRRCPSPQRTALQLQRDIDSLHARRGQQISNASRLAALEHSTEGTVDLN